MLFWLGISFPFQLVFHVLHLTFFPSPQIPQNILPFCMREVWVTTACMALINAIASHFSEGTMAPDTEKEFFRLQGDLYSLCRVKVNKFLPSGRNRMLNFHFSLYIFVIFIVILGCNSRRIIL